MGQITVNTDQLRAKAGQLGHLSGEVEEVAAELSGIISRVDENAYEGQLRKQVRAILDDAKAHADTLAGDLKRLKTRLEDKAAEFDKANEVIKLDFELLAFSATVGMQSTGAKRQTPLAGLLFDQQVTKRIPQTQKEIVKPVGQGGVLSQGHSHEHKALDISSGGKNLPIYSMMLGSVAYKSIVNAGTIKPGTDKAKDAMGKPEINYGYGNSLVLEYKYDDQSAEIKETLKRVYGLSEGKSLYAYHAHLDRISVEDGATLVSGQEVAKMGNDGISSGIHLHLEFATGDSGVVDSYNTWSGLGKRNPDDLLEY